MRRWDVSGNGKAWKVELDVRDLGGRAGTLSKRFRDATRGVPAVGALPLGFEVNLGLVKGKYVLAGLHAVEASHVFYFFFGLFSCCHWSGCLV